MADITWPDIVPVSMTGGLQRNKSGDTAISGKLIEVDHTGDRYVLSVAFPPLQGANATLARVALSRANAVGNALIFPVHYDCPTESGLSPLVRGADQTGTSIVIDGLASGKVIKAGTIMQTSDYDLLEAATDATANGSGIATVSLLRQIRVSPADNDPLQIYTPKGRFQIPEALVQWALSAPMTYELNTRLVEA